MLRYQYFTWHNIYYLYHFTKTLALKLSIARLLLITCNFMYEACESRGTLRGYIIPLYRWHNIYYLYQFTKTLALKLSIARLLLITCNFMYESCESRGTLRGHVIPLNLSHSWVNKINCKQKLIRDFQRGTINSL